MAKNKKQNSQSKQVRQVCIFCGQTPLTKEHFWPTWMKEVLPQSKFNYHARGDFHYSGRNFAKSLNNGYKKITGPPGSWQLKIVCNTCNNNWMSQIENDAKPILTPLALGETIQLEREDQELLIKWVFLKIIIGEYDNVQNQVIKASERKSFYVNRDIPSDWKIWIARVQPALWGNLYNQSFGAIDYTSISTQRSAIHKSKSAIFIIGELVIHAGKFSTEEFGPVTGQIEYFVVGDYNYKVKQIYPMKFKKLDWNNFISLTKEEWNALYDNLKTFSKAFMELATFN